MRILVTGSSGQIGTNLALRLQNEGHEVFGVDKRLNTWTDDFRYLLQDLSGHYPSFPGGIGGVEYPEVDLVVHLAAHAKVHQLVRQPHRALDNDLARMVRVIPLFIHTMQREEPITIFGPEKTLDFTYVDDCIDGITRGIEALSEGRVLNETINLAYGQGNALIRAAELIGAELGTEPKITLAPSLLGEVTHYVADLTKARDLLGYEPQVPLEDGVPRAVAWFREHRAAHPEEDAPLPADTLFPQDAEIGWKSGAVPAS